MTPTTTTNMCPELRAALILKGWNPETVLWGRRVSGDLHGATLEYEGKEFYRSGPFSAIRAGGQIAIVRFG